jgi:mRNA interferase RelE/StbE
VKRRAEWAPRALDDLAGIARTDRRQATRIEVAVERFAETGHGDTLKLAGQGGLYRLRVGDWRVIFTYEDGDLVVLALRVLNRRDAYR